MKPLICSFLVLLVVATAGFCDTPVVPTFPSHSVIGDVTVDVVDIVVPVSYATPEPHAVITLCSDNAYTIVGISVITLDLKNDSRSIYLTQIPSGKYCGMIVAGTYQSNISEIDLDFGKSLRLIAPPVKQESSAIRK